MKLFDVFIAEANVYNISTPYNKVSVQDYVARLLHHLPAGQLKVQLNKKLCHLITNDDSILQPLTELPPKAPEWAARAIQSGQLKVFVPSPEVTDKLEHIVHYIGAAVEDSASNNPDVRSFATRELHGLTKVENLTVFMSKANEYFARGSRNASRSEEGMVEVLSCPGGFKWFKLTTQEGFQREGKLLQNCIGSHYTAQRCRADGTTIYVLRDRNNNSSAAIRINSSEVQEVKGKNNEPPVAKYMPSVQQLINHLPNITLSGTAKRDIQTSGYYFVGTELVTREEAIARLTKVTNLGKTSNNNDIQCVKFDDRELYMDLTVGQRTHAIDPSSAPPLVYKLISGKDTLATAAVVNGVVVDLWARESDKTDALNGSVIELLQFLHTNGKYKRFGTELQRSSLFNHGMYIDPATAETKQLEYDETDTTDTRGKIRVYSKQRGQALLDAVLDTISDGDAQSQVAAERMYVLPAYSNREHDRSVSFTPCAVETTDGMLLPYAWTGDASKIDKYAAVSDKVTDRIINLANKNQLDLPLYWCALTGTTRTEDGFKRLDVPTTKSADGKFTKVDVSSLSPVDRFIATMDILGMQDAQNGPVRSRRGGAYGPTTGSELASEFSSLSAHENDATASEMMAPGYPSDSDLASKWSTIVKQTFGGKQPARVYFKSLSGQSSLSYGRGNKPCMVVVDDNNNVIHIDTFIVTHDWRGASKRVTTLDATQRKSTDDTVAAVNKMVEDEGLTILPSAVKLSYLKVVNNKLTTPTMRLATELGTGADGQLKYDDGTIIRKMKPTEFQEWSEATAEKTLEGKTPYYIIKGGNAIGAVLVAKGKIMGVYGTDSRGGTLPTDTVKLPAIKTFNRDVVSYVKTFADLNNLKLPTAAGALMTASNTQGMYLDDLSQRSIPTPRGTVMRAIGVNQVSAAGFDAPTNTLDRALVATGLVKVERQGSRLNMSITDAGKAVLKRLKAGEEINVYDLVPAAPAKDAPKAEAPKTTQPDATPTTTPTAPAASSASRTGTKASQALDRFRELAAGGHTPTRSEFIAILKAEPFNMSQAGASTYYHNIKVKYEQERGNLGETFTFAEYLAVMAE